VFILKSSDISADLIVDMWVMINARIRQSLRDGRTLEEAILIERDGFGIPCYGTIAKGLNGLGIFGDTKLDGAADIAEAMRQHAPRRLAD
jgi:hypothetical protein